jgi:hypothetical protein
MGEQVWIQGPQPERVLDWRKVHYFYFKWDVYKRHDYEPIKIFKEKVFSRYHWNILTIWLDVDIRKGKPVVNFAKGVHTPFVLSYGYTHRYVELEDIPIEERAKNTLYLALFRLLLEKNLPSGIDFRGYYNKIEKRKPPDKYLFDFKKMKAALIIGRRFPLPDDVPPKIAERLW